MILSKSFSCLVVISIFLSFISQHGSADKGIVTRKDKTADVGGNLILGILKGILDALIGIGTWLLDNICKPIIEGVMSAFGIHSPSTVFAEIGNNLILGFLQGISKTWTSITQFFGIKLPSLNNLMKSMSWNNVGSNLVNGLLNGISSSWSRLTSWLKNAASRLTDWFGGGSSASTSSYSTSKNRSASNYSVPQLASGGMVDKGQLFVANESGPELVGSYGGSSAVMNNAQIVSAVSKGVYDAVMAAMGSNRNSDSGTAIYLEGNMQKFFQAIVKEDKKYRQANGGKSAFA